MLQAWNTEAFSRMEHRHFKAALDKVVSKRPRRRQTAEEMLAILMQAQAGGAPLHFSEVN